ncbi:hypothetical protein [Natronobacterium texcoconense]|uniref:hypothetical protein n=1 Tax=Natronobacterium texcoconense TaxID=1095778 RepID=UPI0011134E8F|nr:hypothetical protein [Natronobacterium texcoconense]
MNRRSYLAVSGLAISTLSAGCLSRSDTETEYAFNLYNAAQEEHSITVRIGSEWDTYFYRETFEMEPNTGNEDISIDDTPARIGIRIDDSDEFEFGWPASISNEGEIASMASLHYDPNDHQQLMVLADN